MKITQNCWSLFSSPDHQSLGFLFALHRTFSAIPGAFFFWKKVKTIARNKQ
jgi:hypothetical protein